MRYTDVLLMLAESENEISGPNGVAQEALKKVRQRAFPTSLWASKVDDYVSASAAGKDQFFEAIVNERAWEFGGEFLRKYDLARWNLYGKKVAEAITTMTQMGADAVAGVGVYSNLPDYLYFRRVGSEIEFLSKYSKVSPPPVLDPINGYSRVNWLRSLYNTTTNGPADYLLRQYRGYQDLSGNTPVRYILPLHSSVIANSLGSLKNDGYGF